MPSLLAGTAFGLFFAFIAGVLGATWGQVFLTHVTVGLLITVASALIMFGKAQEHDGSDVFPTHPDRQEGHGFDGVVRPDHLN